MNYLVHMMAQVSGYARIFAPGALRAQTEGRQDQKSGLEGAETYIA
jgi:hypothetical protein